MCLALTGDGMREDGWEHLRELDRAGRAIDTRIWIPSANLVHRRLEVLSEEELLHARSTGYAMWRGKQGGPGGNKAAPAAALRGVGDRC